MSTPSLVPLQVELPQYSHSFSVQVPHSGSVRDIKLEISRTCPGNPRVEGQRLIWKGRILGDAELVDQLWKSPDEPRMVHLAVNPWAWSGTSPEVLLTPIASPGPSTLQEQVPTLNPVPNAQTPPLTSVPQTRYSALFYIHFLHNNALNALTRAPLSTSLPSEILQVAKQQAKEVLWSCGRGWPNVFDDEFPSEPEGDDQGVKYESVTYLGLPYIQLITPDATPTPLQLHALRVLTYTFPLISLSTPSSGAASSGSGPHVQPLRPNLNFEQHLGQLGLQQHLPAQNGNVGNGNPAVPQIRAIPIRALLTPIIVLCLRTLLLLYFFSPARKPIFGLILGAWVVYEAWGAIRGAIGDVNDLDRNVDHRRRDRGHQDGAGVGGQPAAAGANIPGLDPVAPPPTRGLERNHADIILTRLAHLNLDFESGALTSPEGTRADEPGLGQKVKMLIGLMVLSLHPAIWNRRRAALREREGRVRTEANALDGLLNDNQPEDGGEHERTLQARAQLVVQQERRPLWVREYIERVKRGEWVDD